MRKTPPDILIVGGFGGSGGSSVSSLLSETDAFFIPRLEFRLMTDPDGIINLESALVDNWTVYQADIALKRFTALVRRLGRRNHPGPYASLDLKKDYGRIFGTLARAYASEMELLRFKGLWFGIDDARRRRGANEYLARVSGMKRRLSVREMIEETEGAPDRRPPIAEEILVGRHLARTEFRDATRRFLVSLVSRTLEREGKERFLFDEPFASLVPGKVMSYLPRSARMIVVSRDPRDQFVNMRLSRWIYQPDEIGAYIEFQKEIFRRWLGVKDEVPPSRLLNIRFEDFLWNYEDTVRRVFDFLRLDPSRHERRETELRRSIMRTKVGLHRRGLDRPSIRRLNRGLAEILDYHEYPR